MIQKAAMKRYLVESRNPKYVRDIWKFDSISELMKIVSIPLDKTKEYSQAYSAGNCDSYRHKSGYGDGHYFNSFEEAVKNMEKGWKEGTADIIREVENSPLKMEMYTREKPKYDIVGGNASVPRYLQGIPTNMINRKNKPNKERIITFYKTMPYTWQYSTDELIKEASKSISVIKYYENKGYRVNLYSIKINECDTYYENFGVKVKIKDAAQPMSIKKMAFFIANPDFQRRIAWRLCELHPQIKRVLSGYGAGLEFTNDELRSVIQGYSNKADIYIGDLSKTLYQKYMKFESNEYFLPPVYKHDLKEYIADLNSRLEGRC